MKHVIFYLLLNFVTKFVSLIRHPNNSNLAGWFPCINALHLLFSQQSQYAVGDVFFSLQSWPRWQTFAHSVQQQSVPVRPQVRHSNISCKNATNEEHSSRIVISCTKFHTWLICSAPVHVKLHVSLQQTTYNGELSGFDPSGNIIEYNASERFFEFSGVTVFFFDVGGAKIAIMPHYKI